MSLLEPSHELNHELIDFKEVIDRRKNFCDWSAADVTVVSQANKQSEHHEEAPVPVSVFMVAVPQTSFKMHSIF